MRLHRCTSFITGTVIAFIAIAANARKPSADADFAPPAELAYEIVRMHTHDENRFTQGLEYSAGALIEGTGRYGSSALIEALPGAAAPMREHRLPADVFGEGVTVFGDRIYQLSWREGLLFIYDRGFNLVATRRYEGEGWGLTNDGSQLIMSNGSNVLQFRKATDFSLTRSVEVRDQGEAVAKLNELEYAEGLIFANVWQSDRIAVIDPADGTVLAWLDLSALQQRLPTERHERGEAVLNGIAYDPVQQHFYVTGKLWPLLFELRIADLPRPQAR